MFCSLSQVFCSRALRSILFLGTYEITNVLLKAKMFCSFAHIWINKCLAQRLWQRCCLLKVFAEDVSTNILENCGWCSTRAASESEGAPGEYERESPHHSRHPSLTRHNVFAVLEFFKIKWGYLKVVGRCSRQLFAFKQRIEAMIRLMKLMMQMVVKMVMKMAMQMLMKMKIVT